LPDRRSATMTAVRTRSFKIKVLATSSRSEELEGGESRAYRDPPPIV
jgi:hypothetical protein